MVVKLHYRAISPFEIQPNPKRIRKQKKYKTLVGMDIGAKILNTSPSDHTKNHKTN